MPHNEVIRSLEQQIDILREKRAELKKLNEHLQQTIKQIDEITHDAESAERSIAVNRLIMIRSLIINAQKASSHTK